MEEQCKYICVVVTSWLSHLSLQAAWVWCIIFLCSMPLAAAILAAFGGFIAAGFAVLPASEYWVMQLLGIGGGSVIMIAWVSLVLFTLSIRGFNCCACCTVP